MGTVSATGTCPGCCGGCHPGSATYPCCCAPDCLMVTFENLTIAGGNPEDNDIIRDVEAGIGLPLVSPGVWQNTFTITSGLVVAVRITCTPEDGFILFVGQGPLGEQPGGVSNALTVTSCSPLTFGVAAGGIGGGFNNEYYQFINAAVSPCQPCCTIPPCMRLTFEDWIVDNVNTPGATFDFTDGEYDGGRIVMSLSCQFGRMKLVATDTLTGCTLISRNAPAGCPDPFAVSFPGVTAQSGTCAGSGFTWTIVDGVDCTSPMRMRPAAADDPFLGVLMAGSYPDAGGQAA